jgi:hypothetical protein
LVLQSTLMGGLVFRVCTVANQLVIAETFFR